MGDNVVYVEHHTGRLHWIGHSDEPLGLTGSAPALTYDGALLAYIGSDGSLMLYHRGDRRVRRFGTGTFKDITFGGRFIFAVTGENRLVRIDPAAGVADTWLEPAPEVMDLQAALNRNVCPLVCYGVRSQSWFVGRGMAVFLAGKFLDQPNWRARIGETEVSFRSISSTSAWLQIPNSIQLVNGVATRTLSLYSPTHPVTFSITLEIRDTALTCLGTLHESFSRAVTSDYPASSGEIVHVFVTGLQGKDPVPDGVPNPVDHLVSVVNPPLLADPEAAEVVFFGLAPGLVGIQQLDLRIHHASSKPSAALFRMSGWQCTYPAVSSF
jgi:uncharacterized protein (TIGR03437 family)